MASPGVEGPPLPLLRPPLLPADWQLTGKSASSGRARSRCGAERGCSSAAASFVARASKGESQDAGGLSRFPSASAVATSAWGAVALLLGRIGGWDTSRRRHSKRRPAGRPRVLGRCVASASATLSREDEDADRAPEAVAAAGTEAGDLSPAAASAASRPPRRVRVALLLNRNARGVSDKVERRLRAVVGDEDCFACDSMEDAEEAVRELLARDVYAAIACGGGDGTLTNILNLLSKEQRRRRKDGNGRASPALAVLRLGTGNAMCSLVGAGRDAAGNLRDLMRRAAAGDDLTMRSGPAKLLSLRFGTEAAPESAVAERPVSGPDEDAAGSDTLCFFAGLGFDARMLQDYTWLKSKTQGSRLLAPWVHSPLGYVLAFFIRTLPATLRGAHVFRVRIINLDEEAYWIDSRRGDWAVPRRRGEVLYEGPVGIVCMGTVPFYGGGFRLFPFAGFRGDMAHLRISDINPFIGSLSMQSLWKGNYRNQKHVFDFLVRDVVIEMDRLVPLQHSGELVGEVQRLHVRVPEDTHGAQLVDLMKPLL